MLHYIIAFTTFRFCQEIFSQVPHVDKMGLGRSQDCYDNIVYNEKELDRKAKLFVFLFCVNQSPNEIPILRAVLTTKPLGSTL